MKHLSSSIGFVIVKYQNIVIVGDLNVNVLDRNNATKELKNISKSHGMAYLVDFPTRVTETSATAIDHFWPIFYNMLSKETWKE